MTTITDQTRDRAQRDRLADALLDTAPHLGHQWTDRTAGRLERSSGFRRASNGGI
ncbi:hypothetical protein [Nonomuraea sp. GTA35]|uniref:hypothetical protein n=1 Tax=Nonomuraea sp. GTA35 TaxID=1676746 RepID=UPI0035C055A1